MPASTPDQTPAPSQVQSVERALAVLDLLAEQGEMGVTELAAVLDVHKSTAFRLVMALESRRLVAQVGDRGKYRLGLGILRLAAVTTGRLDVTRESRPVCEELAAEFGETVNVAILDEGSAVNVVQEFGTASISTRDWVGRRTPLHATSSGKVLLAHAAAAVRDEVLTGGLERLTEATITDRRLLAAELATVRERGWAGTAEELEVGLNAVAAPIWDGDGRVTAAISVSGPSYRLDVERFADVGVRLLAGAREISRRLGYYTPG